MIHYYVHYKLVENRIKINAKPQDCLEAESESLRKSGKAGMALLLAPRNGNMRLSSLRWECVSKLSCHCGNH